eukprot:SAG31_NODE_2340_length_5920_cov_4.296561_2_plen_138_part_00
MTITIVIFELGVMEYFYSSYTWTTDEKNDIDRWLVRFDCGLIFVALAFYTAYIWRVVIPAERARPTDAPCLMGINETDAQAVRDGYIITPYSQGNGSQKHPINAQLGSVSGNLPPRNSLQEKLLATLPAYAFETSEL